MKSIWKATRQLTPAGWRATCSQHTLVDDVIVTPIIPVHQDG
jgi:hypothetical protein